MAEFADLPGIATTEVPPPTTPQPPVTINVGVPHTNGASRRTAGAAATHRDWHSYEGVPQTAMACAKFINRMADENLYSSEGYQVRVFKMYPYGEIQDAPQASFEEIRAFLREGYGAGTYKFQIFKNGNIALGNQSQCILEFTDKLSDSQFAANGIGRDGRLQNGSAEDDPVVRLRKECSVADLEAMLAEKRARLAKVEEKTKAEDSARASGPVDMLVKSIEKQNELLQKQIEQLREDLNRAHRYDPDRKPGPNIAEILAALSPILGPVLLEIVKGKNQLPPPPPPQKDPLEIVGAIGKMMVELRPKEDNTMKEVLVPLITSAVDQKMNGAQDQFKLMLDMEERGSKRTEKFYERMEEIRGKQEGEDFKVDPNNIWGSIVAAIVEGGYNLMKDPSVAGMIASKLNKPAAQVTQTDLVQMAQQLQAQERARLNAPLTTPMAQRTGQAAQTPLQAGLPPFFEPLPKAKAPAPFVPAPTPAMAQPTAPTPVLAGTGNSPGGESSPVETLPSTDSNGSSSAAVASQQESTDPAMEADLRESISNTVEHVMLVDLKAKREEHEWVYDAKARWHEAFLQRLAGVPAKADGDETEADIVRLQMIREKVSPELMAKVDALIQPTFGNVNVGYFHMAFRTLVRLIKGIVETEKGSA